MAWELQFLDFLQTLHTPIGDLFNIAVTRLGDSGILWIILTIILLIIPRTRKVGIVMFACLLVSIIISNAVLKILIARPRPFEARPDLVLLIERPTDWSFPSGHTTASFASATALFLAGQKKSGIIALIVACLIAFSRLYLYVHFPTDILGGVIVGVGGAWLGYQLLKWIEMTLEKRKNA